MKDEFGKYYEAVEPGRRERAYAWATAIGLQDVDGLKVSSFLAKTAIRNIEGEITQDQARQIIDEHYAMIARNDKKPRYSGYEYLDPVTGEKIESLDVYEAQRRIAQATSMEKPKRRGGRKNGEWCFERIED